MDIRIGHDRTEPCFPDKGGTRILCPFCDWYLDHTPIWDDVRYEPSLMYDLSTVSIPNFRAMWTRVDKIAEAHLIETHPEETRAAVGERAYASLVAEGLLTGDGGTS